MDKGDLIQLELAESTVCSLAIMVRSSQGQIIQALSDLKEMLEDSSKRPDHLKTDEEVINHINLHTLLIADSEIILTEVEQGITELAAENHAKAQIPFWEKIKP